MRILCLDPGRRRIGVAISDETELIATPRGVIFVKTPEQVFNEIARLVKETESGKVVIGLPIQLNGKEGIEANRARKFGASLGRFIEVPVDFMDERLTSVEADRLLMEAGIKPHKRKASIDATAAALILQTYLDSKRSRYYF